MAERRGDAASGRSWRCAIGAVAALIASAVACRAPAPPPPGLVVLVTIDTLRADHLGAYGYPRSTTPFLDSLAANGALFERAIAASATTAPSHASLFTGLHPSQHGVRNNFQKLRPEVPTLAEHMANAGFDTAAFVALKTHFQPNGLHRGFGVFGRPLRAGAHVERTAARTVKAVRNWLDAGAPGRPLFLWVHFFDPHTPYEAPPFPREADGGRELARHLLDHQKVSLNFFAGSEENLLTLADAYDGEIAAADAALRELHALVTARLPARRSVWIVTSDHGEGLGNHGWLLHGRHVYNEQLRVPLVIWDSAGAWAGVRSDAVVSHVDLLPTIREIAGVAGAGAKAPGAADESVGEGRSLVPVLEGEGEGRPAWSERRSIAPGGVPFDPAPPDPFTLDSLIALAERAGFEAGEKYVLQNQRFKYVHHTSGADALYDLANDAYELENLAGRGLPAEGELRRAIRSKLDRLRPADRAGERVSPGVAEGLRALGYTE